MRTVITEGITVRPFASSLSSKATTRYKAHAASCRYANTGQPMADLVARLGHDAVRTKVAVGIIEVCAVCQPTLLAETGSLVEAVKAHALAHYEDGGWDVIVECWEDQQIADALANAADPIDTPEEAIAHFRDGVVAIWADQQADARNSAF